MNLLRIPLLCKERLGEAESWCPRESHEGINDKCWQEATSPRYCLVRPDGRVRC